MVPVTFFGNMNGVMGTFLQELDVDGIWTGMTQFGNWWRSRWQVLRTRPVRRRRLVRWRRWMIHDLQHYSRSHGQYRGA